MPRNYIRKGNKASWTSDALNSALDAINEGVALREVSRRFNIPRSTLQDYRKNGRKSAVPLGRKAVFSAQEEEELASHIIKLSKLFFGITPNQIKQCAFAYATKNNLKHPFTIKNEAAGRDWLAGFLRRNPGISLRRPEATSINRITAFNRTEVSLFYENLGSLMERFRFPQARIFNADETGITTVQRPNKIYAETGQKRVGFVTSWERGKTTTAMCAFSASGIYVPPMFIYARKRMAQNFKKNGPPGAIYVCSDNGWMNENLFLDWLNHFQNFVKSSQEDPILLILDNHVSHCTLKAYNYCKENFISLLTIPPHTSHRTQPLDVAFYAALKSAYNSECDKYMRSHPGEKITPNEIAELFNKAYGRIATPEKAINGFKATGIFPLNPDTFTDDDFIAAENLNIDREKTPELITAVVDSNEEAVSFSEIIPIPDTSKSGDHGLQKNNKRKQHSQIFTSTPMKDILEEKEIHKTKRLQTKRLRVETAKKNLYYNPGPSDANKENSHIRIKTQREKTKKVQYKEHQDDDFEGSDNEVTEDICIICGEFGKNNEMWIRCVICGQWAHQACSVDEKTTYVCDFCI